MSTVKKQVTGTKAARKRIPKSQPKLSVVSIQTSLQSSARASKTAPIPTLGALKKQVSAINREMKIYTAMLRARFPQGTKVRFQLPALKHPTSAVVSGHYGSDLKVTWMRGKNEASRLLPIRLLVK